MLSNWRMMDGAPEQVVSQLWKVVRPIWVNPGRRGSTGKHGGAVPGSGRIMQGQARGFVRGASRNELKDRPKDVTFLGMAIKSPPFARLPDFPSRASRGSYCNRVQ